MKFTAFNTSTGQVLFSGTADSPHTLLPPDSSILEGVALEGGWIENDVHVVQPVQPSINHVFNWHTKQWEDPRTLADLKDAQWATIKQARSTAEYAGFTWDGSTFDSDAISQQRITGAVTLAQMNSAFTIDWILANNTIRTLNCADMLQVGEALGAHVAAQFAKGVLLRVQIEAAGTAEQVEAVVW